MDPIDHNELSDAELELLGDYLTRTQEIYTTTAAEILTTEEIGDDGPFGAGLADVLPYITDSVSSVDRQVIRFDDMRRTLKQMADVTPHDRELPDDAQITPVKLHKWTIRSQLTSYYSMAGALLEEFSVQLIIDAIVDEERQSDSVRDDIESKSQWEREWLLYVTGEIDSGRRGNLRETYRRRNELVHNSFTQSSVEDIEINSAIQDAWESVDILHEKLFGVQMKHRIGELALGNEPSNFL